MKQFVINHFYQFEGVAALAGVRMSIRAIAGLLGVGVGTVHREMVGGFKRS